MKLLQLIACCSLAVSAERTTGDVNATDEPQQMVVEAQGSEDDVKTPSMPDRDHDGYFWTSQILGAVDAAFSSVLGALDDFLLHVVFVNNATTTTPPKGDQCGSPFVFVGDRCLLLVLRNLREWSEAKDLCTNFDSTLLNLEDKNFWMKLVSYMNEEHNWNIDMHIWTGANDIANEGHWRWEDSGAKVDMSSETGVWYPGEPSVPQANCGALFLDYDYKMAAIPCYAGIGFICQAKKQPGTKVSTDAVQQYHAMRASKHQ